jgi:hypothetical protein
MRDICAIIESSPKPMSRFPINSIHMTNCDESYEVQITHVYQNKLKIEKYIETFQRFKAKTNLDAMRVGESHIISLRYEIRSKVRMLIPTTMESAIKYARQTQRKQFSFKMCQTWSTQTGHRFPGSRICSHYC